MKTIDEVQQEIVDEFGVFDDWLDKYSFIIEQGNALKPLDDKYKTLKILLRDAKAGCGCRQLIVMDGFIFRQIAMP